MCVCVNRNYENRIHDLQKKIGVIERDNARLEEEICEMKDKQEKAEAERIAFYLHINISLTLLAIRIENCTREW
jgi:predicted  nucleic acid-binding Zn-ribbon protein